MKSRCGPLRSLKTGLLLAAALATPTVGQATERSSIDSLGTQGNDRSLQPSISADGRYVAFWSWATNLVNGDTNARTDVFLRDRQDGTTERVSLGAFGQGTGDSSFPSISANGRYVAFQSAAPNLVSGDTNGAEDIFVRDRQSGTTELVSVENGNEGNDRSIAAAISADGRYVAFLSLASNLVSGDTNGSYDVFVRDRQGDVTERVSLDSLGSEGNGPSLSATISADGRYVAFSSSATNLVIGDRNGSDDVFVRDRLSGTTERQSLDGLGTEGNGNSRGPSISADGRYVAFYSAAMNLVNGDTNGVEDIFVRDRKSGATERVSVGTNGVEGDGRCLLPSISADGRYVAFYGAAANLVSGDTNGSWDAFVRDRQSNTTELVSVDSIGTPANDHSEQRSISADGRYVAFYSAATNLAAGDTNGAWDVFVRDRHDSTPPTLCCPIAITALDDKGAPFGEIVTFSITVTDNQDPAPSIVCVPPSGSTFPRGTTIVTCQATDSSGNQSTCAFPVSVLPTVRRR